MFSANVLPRSSDDTYAYYSRWILIEFINLFDPQKGTGDPDLDSKLQTPEELSGLLNIALAGLKRLRENRWKFSYDKTVEDVEIMYKRNANPVLAFMMDECEAASSSYIEKTVFNNGFNDYAKKHGIRPLSPTRFVVLLKDQTEIPVSDYRPHFSGGDAAPRCWLGVRFKEYAFKSQQKTDIFGPQSTPSILLPTPSSRENENKGQNEKNSSREDRDKKNPGRGGLLEDNDHLGCQPWNKKRHCLECGRDFSYDLGIHLWSPEIISHPLQTRFV
jgi:phage/plasmid-associated DNA primase